MQKRILLAKYLFIHLFLQLQPYLLCSIYLGSLLSLATGHDSSQFEVFFRAECVLFVVLQQPETIFIILDQFLQEKVSFYKFKVH